MSNHNTIKLSVIIPTRNRCKLLQETLDSLMLQTLESKFFEIIVIDNGSTDLTFSTSQKYYSKFNNFRYFYCATPGLHVGRNIGFLESKSEILVYCDDDIEPNREWLFTIKQCFDSDESIGVLGGNNIPKFIENPPDWLSEMWQISTPFSSNKMIPELSLIYLKYKKLTNINPSLIWGCNFSIKRSIVESAGGFNPDGMPVNMLMYRGDGESNMANFAIKMGYKTMFHPLASVYHKVTKDRMVEEYFKDRSFAIGISASYSTLKNKNVKIVFKKSRFSSYISFIKNYINKLYLLLFQSKKLKQIKNNNILYFQKGYDFHLNQYNTSIKIQEWVHSNSYMYEYNYASTPTSTVENKNL
jgi:glycosyltransferase involved in cell wall biosynthesis